MNNNRTEYTEQDILELLTEEKEAYAQYLRLCERYQIEPNQTAMSVSRTTQNLLMKFLDGKLKLLTSQKKI